MIIEYQMTDIKQCKVFETQETDIIQIDTSCVESEPCYHNVFMNEKFYAEMNGVEIVGLLRENHQHIPEHFKCYINYKDIGMELFD